MKKIAFLLVLLLVFSLTTATLAAGSVGQATDKVNVLIAFDCQPGKSEQALVRAFGGSINSTYTIVPAIAAKMPAQAILHLANNPHVLLIEPDAQIQASADEVSVTWGVDHIGADDVQASGNNGAGIKVAILDSGIDYNHPDLDDNFAGGYDFVNNDSDPLDDNGHGTHVAGTIGAESNGMGVIGVAPDVEIYALKVLDENGIGNFSNVLDALEWCVAHGIQVTNNSYSSSVDPGSIFQSAFDNAYAAGIIHVAAAGNSGNPPGKGDTVNYPAKYSSVIAVAATDSRDKRASFSSTGPAVEVAAPGVEVLSTIPGGGYDTGSGTSMASPHVAGTVALMLSAGMTDPQAIRSKLQATAIDLGSAGLDPLYGFGLIDANQAAGFVVNSPAVAITSPEDGAVYLPGEAIVFTGTASDIEDGDLSGSIRWTSDLDGILGDGSSITTTLSEGTHTVTASAADADGHASNAVISVTVSSALPFEGIVSVSDISYATAGGKGGTAHLLVTASVIDDLYNPVAGASVTIEIYHNTSLYATLSGTTGSDGEVVLKLPNAPSGSYSSAVSHVSAGDLAWDTLTPANGYVK